MADDSLTVAVTGEAGGATDALKDVAEGVKSLQEAVNKSREDVASFKDEFLKAFTVEKIFEFVEAMTNAATQIERLTTALGTTAAQVATFDVAAKSAGTTVSAISEAMTRLENNVARAAAGVERSKDALGDLNLRAADFKGLNLDQKIDLVASKLAVLKDGTEKTAAAQQLLGGAATYLLPILNRGAGAFEEYAAVVKRSGVDATPEFITEMSRLDLSIIEAKASLGGLGQTIATAFAPALSGLAGVFSTIAQSINNSVKEGGAFAVVLNTLVISAQAFATAIVVAVAAVQTLWEVVKTAVFAMGEAFSTLGTIIKSVFEFNFEAAKQAFADLGTQLQARAKITADNMESVMRSMTGNLKTIWNQAAEEKEKVDQTEDVNRRRRNADAISAALARMEAEVAAAKEALKQKTSVLELEASLGQITQNQKFAQLQQYTELAYQEELKTLQNELSIGGLRLAQRQQILNRIAALEGTHRTEMINLDRQSITAQFAQWKTYTDAVAGAFNAQLQGLLTGQLSFTQAMKNILLQLSVQLIELVVTKPVAAYISGQLAMLTATQTGAAATAAAAVAGETAALPAKVAAFTSDIAARSALTFAGIFANLSPFLGPAAAGPAEAGQAVVLAQLAAVPKFELGSWSVPQTGQATVHRGEFIARAGAEADTARNAVTGGDTGGGGDVTHVWNLSAVDGASMGQWLKSGGAALLSKAVSGYQDKNPSTRNRK